MSRMSDTGDILTPCNGRYSIFPIEHESFWSAYKQHLSTFWTPEEVRLVAAFGVPLPCSCLIILT